MLPCHRGALEGRRANTFASKYSEMIDRRTANGRSAHFGQSAMCCSRSLARPVHCPLVSTSVPLIRRICLPALCQFLQTTQFPHFFRRRFRFLRS
jgi:hypothetical protein